ncbi:MAG: carbon-nitrogen hydrolase family protein [Bacteroidota bacterium]
MIPPESLKIGLAQISPVWLNREATLKKVQNYMRQAAAEGCRLVVFGEALLPGYPFWVELTEGARFNSQKQKEIFAHYAAESIQISAGHLDPVCKTANELGISVVLGIVERPADRGGHSLYCSLVHIDAAGNVEPVHRKLVPTYEERLVWANGDGHGLRVHPCEGFSVGALNCWENWMPTARAALHAQGENLHLALWPGNVRNTQIITPFMALEARSFVASVSSVLRAEDLPDTLPWKAEMVKKSGEWLADGGTCLAAPDGSWMIEPCEKKEALLTATLDHSVILAERHNFDPTGHYARPDVLRLKVNRERQRMVNFDGANESETPWF